MPGVARTKAEMSIKSKHSYYYANCFHQLSETNFAYLADLTLCTATMKSKRVCVSGLFVSCFTE